MPLLITNAILHIAGNREGGSLFSNVELDVDSEACSEFVSRHVRRLLNSPGAKEATFTAESAVYSIVKAYQKSEMHFRDMSRQLCERLVEIIKQVEDIPPADILVVAFDNGENRYLAILKLNYGECFTHKLVKTEDGVENQIIKNTAVLPLSASKVDEACLIPYDPMVLRILEKPHTMNGEETFYFSKLFLECETEISKKEAAEIIREVTEEINAKYFGGDLEVDAKIKCALIEETEQTDEDNGLKLENVARRVFPENEEVKTEFINMAKESGLPYEVKLDKPFVQREFKMQKFKADNGIEIKCPSELFRDPDSVVLINNPDGTISITLKNLRRYDPMAL